MTTPETRGTHTLHHHSRCPRGQAWDVGDVVPCDCPPGWPRRECAPARGMVDNLIELEGDGEA